MGAYERKGGQRLYRSSLNYRVMTKSLLDAAVADKARIQEIEQENIRTCNKCGRSYTYIHKNHPCWHRVLGGTKKWKETWECHTCYNRRLQNYKRYEELRAGKERKYRKSNIVKVDDIIT